VIISNAFGMFSACHPCQKSKATVRCYEVFMNLRTFNFNFLISKLASIQRFIEIVEVDRCMLGDDESEMLSKCFLRLKHPLKFSMFGSCTIDYTLLASVIYNQKRLKIHFNFFILLDCDGCHLISGRSQSVQCLSLSQKL
jgi:hypothetical protein